MSDEEEVFLTVTKINNHPKFEINTGPIGGYDIAVYHVDDSKLRKKGVVKQGKIYPACLPSLDTSTSEGRFASWKDPTPLNVYYESSYKYPVTVEKYRRDQLLMKHTRLDRGVCKDPSWMDSNTYYPKGIVLLISVLCTVPLL